MIPTNALVVPVSSRIPHQEQNTTLSGRRFRLRFDWIQRLARWSLSIYTSNGDPILTNKMIVLGADLFRQARYDTRLPLGALICVDTGGLDREPSLDSFGIDQKLLFIRPEDLSDG